MVRRSSTRGFTLVELMVVVAIVGVLATLGVYGVRRYVLAAKTTEATEIINSIRAAQEQYKDERFRYLHVSSVDKTSGSFFPFATKAELSENKKIAWYADTSGVPALWAELGIAPSTAVQFGYACAAGQGAGVPTQGALGTSVDLGYPASASDWYVARAMADRGGSGTYTIVVGSSFTDAIHIDNESD